MSTRYIPQLNNQNFVYPNYDLAEYDVDVIQNINEYSVSGTVSNFVVSGTARTTGITFSANYTWAKNSAETFVTRSGYINLVSFHMISGGQSYYKPWRCVNIVRSATTISPTYSGTTTFTVTPSMMGLTTFATGTYYFEIRMIGLKSIYPICQTLSITVS